MSVMRPKTIRWLVPLMALSLLTALWLPSPARATDPAAEAEGIYLHAGSPLILSGSEVAFLDSGNPGVAALLTAGRTLVPLRALAEHFGAEVSFDPETRRVEIRSGENVSIFFADQPWYHMVRDGKETRVEMDTRVRIIQGRTMVPLRVISESVLDQPVFYRDGVIAVGKTAAALAERPDVVTNVKQRIGAVLRVENEKELSALLSATPDPRYGLKDEAAQEAPAADAPDGLGSGEGSGDYSTTNIQVEGVDEADILKTDGKYLYIGGNNAVRIVRADGSRMSEAAQIRMPDEKQVQELYLDGDRLVVLGNRYEAGESPGPGDPRIMEEKAMIWPGWQKNFSYADVYNISDPSSPVLLKTHEMEGSYISSRKAGDIVYLITNSWPSDGRIVPYLRDTATGNQVVPLAVDDVLVMPDFPARGYVVLSALNIRDREPAVVEAMTTSGHLVYMNRNSLYLAADRYDGTTEISRFQVDGMRFGYAGTARIRGRLLNQFSMDEHNGHLRVAATTDAGNAVYVLDSFMEPVGSLTGLAPGEQIYSMRLMGDTGYMVTFRTIDPLFVLDLADPTAPSVAGELKIPGFSNYLHPVGDGLILGIGLQTNELFERDDQGREEVIGFRTGGIKVSLFDVSDQGNPREISSLVTGENGSYAEALYNHRAVLTDPASDRIIFDATISTDKATYTPRQGALVISYGGNRITSQGILEYQEPEIYGKYLPYGRRVAFIGNTLYYFQDSIIQSFDYQTLAPTGSLMLR